MESKANYVFATTTGHRYSGSLKTNPENPAMILTAEDTGEVEVPAVELVTMSPFKTKFWDRVSLNLDFGYSLTKIQSER